MGSAKCNIPHMSGGKSKERHYIVRNGVWDTVNYPYDSGGTNFTQRSDHIQVNFGGMCRIHYHDNYFKGIKKLRFIMKLDMDLSRFGGWFELFGVPKFGITGTKTYDPRYNFTNHTIIWDVDTTVFDFLNGINYLLTFRSINNTWGANAKIYELSYYDASEDYENA